MSFSISSGVFDDITIESVYCVEQHTNVSFEER